MQSCPCSSCLLFRGLKVTSKRHLTCCRGANKITIIKLEVLTSRWDKKVSLDILTFLSRLQLLRSWFSVLRHFVFPRMASILKLITLVTWGANRAITGGHAVTPRWIYRPRSRTWVWAAVTETSLNIFLLLEIVLKVFTACWAASWTSNESGVLSNQPPSRGTFSGFDTDTTWWCFWVLGNIFMVLYRNLEHMLSHRGSGSVKYFISLLLIEI